jgi:hypothetical protein
MFFLLLLKAKKKKMNLMNCVVPHQFSQEKSQYHFHIIKKEDPVFIFEKKAIFHFFIS